MKTRQRAFTLIELLVVIAIIALLISILLPNLKQARETARMVISQANLKQQAVATFGYHSENKDYWPGDHYEGTGGSWIAWAPRLRAYLGGGDKAAQVFYCPSTPKDFRWETKARSADMPPGCKDLGYSDLREQGLNYDVSGKKMYFSYGYNGGGANWQVGGGPGEQPLGLGEHVPTFAANKPPKWMWECKNSDIIMPSRMVAIGDGTGDGLWDTSVFGEEPINPNTGLQSNGFGARHGGKANIMNADFAVSLRNPKDLIIKDPTISAVEKIKRIEQWNRQGKSFNASQGI